jgi:hypothetical protein
MHPGGARKRSCYCGYFFGPQHTFNSPDRSRAPCAFAGFGLQQPASLQLRLQAISKSVPKLCQNPICLRHRELLFEREQVPQVVEIRHFRMESMESLEPANILRSQQV